MESRTMNIAVDNSRSAYTVYMAMGFACMLLLLIAVDHYHASESVNEVGIQEQAFSKENKASSTARKLLALSGNGTDDYGDGDGDGDGSVGGGGGDGGGGGGAGAGADGNGDADGDSSADGGSTNRIGQSSCSKENILIFQGQTAPLPNGIPTYTSQVQNVCGSGSCSISNIHLSCWWFSSARLINPRIFRRLSYNDCLVKDGQALNPGESLNFQYANTFSPTLSPSHLLLASCYLLY